MEEKRKHLIILDLNGVLVHSSFHKIAVGSVSTVLRARTKWVYVRPFLSELLSFLFEHFDVAVWSSNIRDNVMSISQLIFSAEQLSELKFIYSRDQCILGKGYTSVKDLNRVWFKFPQYSSENTIIIDDDPEKIPPQQRELHLVSISSFDPIQARDDSLLRLKERLEKILVSRQLRISRT